MGRLILDGTGLGMAVALRFERIPVDILLIVVGGGEGLSFDERR